MAFRDTIKFQAFKRSGGRCECRRSDHQHYGGCRSMVSRQHAVYLHKRPESEGGGNTLMNCEVVCASCFLELQQAGAVCAEDVAAP